MERKLEELAVDVQSVAEIDWKTLLFRPVEISYSDKDDGGIIQTAVGYYAGHDNDTLYLCHDGNLEKPVSDMSFLERWLGPEFIEVTVRDIRNVHCLKGDTAYRVMAVKAH